MYKEYTLFVTLLFIPLYIPIQSTKQGMSVTEGQFQELNKTMLKQFETVQDRMKIQIGEVLEKLGCKGNETLMKKLDSLLSSEIKPLRNSFQQVYSKVRLG